jgi:hypothetical protein
MKKIFCPICQSKINTKFTSVYKNISQTQTSIFDKKKIHRCFKCSFSFAYPFIKESELKYYYKNSYNFIVDNINLNQNKYYCPDRLTSLILLTRMFIKFSKSDHIIDIGCDHGDSFYVIKKIIGNLNFTAVEPNKKCHNSLKKLGVKRIISNLYNKNNFPKLNSRYKLAILSNVIEHLNASKIKSFLLLVRKIIQENGYILIEVPFEDVLNNKEKQYEHSPHLSFFELESLKKILKNAGYKILYANQAGEIRNDWLNNYKKFLIKQEKKGGGGGGEGRVGLFVRQSFLKSLCHVH